MKKHFLLLLSLLVCLSLLLTACEIPPTLGEKGEQGEPGEKGDPGISVLSILKTGTDGLVDTYTITYTDGNTTTFTVTNGAKGIQGVAGADGHTPTITIQDGYWYIDGVNTQQSALGVSGEKGDPGRGIHRMEILDGCLWVTYTDDPETPVNLGCIQLPDESPEELFDFYPLPDGTYGITAGKALYMETVVIPESYNEKPVTHILPNAFRGAIFLKQIALPAGITDIGAYAFGDCPSLAFVNFCGTEEEWQGVSLAEHWDENATYTLSYRYVEEKIRIYIDQGHNPNPYHNSGAEGNGLYEQDLTYEVGHLLAELLRVDGRFEVALSRPTEDTVLGVDNDTSLDARAADATAFEADYFISLHMNAYHLESANGTEIWVADEEGESHALATVLQEALVTSAGTQDRGVKLNPELRVLKLATMPAVLVEMAFITNPDDAARIDEQPELFSEGLYQGILAYLGF